MSPSLPPIARVRQTFRQPEVADVPAAIAAAIRGSRIAERVPPGGSVALTVGSRGIAGIDRIARAAVEALRGLGFAPVRRRRDGEPRRRDRRGPARRCWPSSASPRKPSAARSAARWTPSSSAPTAFGLPIHFDRNAYEADGIVLLNRIKPHTSFTGRYESGLLKMLDDRPGQARGGRAGPQARPAGAPKSCSPRSAPSCSEKTPVALGVALLENAARARRRGSSRSSPRSCSTSSPACSTRPAA